MYYIYNVPKNSKRGSHDYKNTQQVLICVRCSIKVTCFDGKHKTEYVLNTQMKPYIYPNIWRESYNHFSDAVVLVLSSPEYDENDCIRNYNEFIGT